VSISRGKLQYRRVTGGWPGDHTSVRLGKSLRMPRKNVSGPATKRVARNSGRMASLNVGRALPAATMALISEAKSSSSGVSA
jgi:hypothetical protein